jgi:hypothetical protein
MFILKKNLLVQNQQANFNQTWHKSSFGKGNSKLFVLFWVARAIFQLSGDCHHCRRQGCKFRLNAFSSEGSFTCHTYCDTGPPFLRSCPKDPWFYLLNAVLLAKEQSLPILNVLGLMRPARAGFELTTYRLLRESTTTRLRNRLLCWGSGPWASYLFICAFSPLVSCLTW